MKNSSFPAGWHEQRVRKVIDHYERQSEDEAVAEDEAAYEDGSCTLVPKQASFFSLQSYGLNNFVWTQLPRSSQFAG